MVIVVGVSPTTGSPAALRWAAEEAALRSLELEAVMAWHQPRTAAAPAGRPPAASLTGAVEPPELAAQHQLGAFVDTALGVGARVSCRVVRGTAARALLSASRGAALLVVGEPRPGRLASVRSGLLAPQLVIRAGCPVVVMPAGEPG